MPGGFREGREVRHMGCQLSNGVAQQTASTVATRAILRPAGRSLPSDNHRALLFPLCTCHTATGMPSLCALHQAAWAADRCLCGSCHRSALQAHSGHIKTLVLFMLFV